MNKLMIIVPALLFAALTGLWVVNCSGPKPQVTSVRLEPPRQPGQPYQIEATVQNAGPGAGEAKVTFRLRDKASGQVFKEEKAIQLERGETIRLAAEIAAPEGDYEPAAEAEYPPR